MKKKLVNVIYPNPKIFTVKNFISDSICDSLINSFGEEVLVSKVTDGENIDISNQRKSSTLFLKNELKEVIYIKKKLHDLFNLLPENLETIQFTKYVVGDSYKPHFDAFESNLIKQRKSSLIIYLNENMEGGETHFNEIGLSVKPKKKMLLGFQNCINDSNFLNPFTRHESKEIKNGEKYILSIFSNDVPKCI